MIPMRLLSWFCVDCTVGRDDQDHEGDDGLL